MRRSARTSCCGRCRPARAGRRTCTGSRPRLPAACAATVRRLPTPLEKKSPFLALSSPGNRLGVFIFWNAGHQAGVLTAGAKALELLVAAGGELCAVAAVATGAAEAVGAPQSMRQVWAVLRYDGPNHLDLQQSPKSPKSPRVVVHCVRSAHNMARITSGGGGLVCIRWSRGCSGIRGLARTAGRRRRISTAPRCATTRSDFVLIRAADFSVKSAQAPQAPL